MIVLQTAVLLNCASRLSFEGIKVQSSVDPLLQTGCHLLDSLESAYEHLVNLRLMAGLKERRERGK